MRNKKLKLSAVLLLGLGLTGLHAQTMYVNEKSGKQTAYPLNTVQKMTFSGGKVTVQKTDNSEGGFAFVDVKYINYTSAPADFTAPSVPANVAKTGQSTSTASFSWTASTDNVGVVYYLIFKDGVKIDSVTTTSYTATALSANTTYSFTVKAGDAAKNVSAASTALSVTTSAAADITAPSTPANLLKTGQTASSVSFSWNASTDNVGVLYYLIFKDGVKIDSVTTTSYTATALSANTTYSFTVKAGDAAKNVSAASTALTATTSAAVDVTAPSVPVNVAKTGLTASSVSFSWTASTDNVGVVYYLIFKDGVKIDSVTTTSYTATALSANTTYSFTVKAGDAAKNVSAASTALSATTTAAADITAPSVPVNVAKTGLTASTVSFSWNASTDNVGVVYYLIFKDGVKIDSVTTTSYTATALSANTTYSFTVKAGDAAKNVSAASTALSVTTSKSTGIEDLHLVSLIAYPSPVADILNVDLSGLGNGTLCILTLEGKLLLEQTAMGAGIVSINLSQLAQGMYQCRFVTATGFRSVQIVKQ